MKKITGFLRCRYLVPLSNVLDTRIEDGLVVWDMKKGSIDYVGSFREYQLSAHDFNPQSEDEEIFVVGAGEKKCVKVGKEIPMVNGVLMPSFIKGHGHDYQTNLIGVAKDVPLTTWLDNSVNPFSHFIHFNEEELANDHLGMSPYLLTAIKAKLDDLAFGITASLAHHCDLCKFHVKELVDACELFGVSTTIAVGCEDRNYPEFILDSSISDVVQRLDDYYNSFDNGDTIRIIPGPDQLFSNSGDMLQTLKDWSISKNTLFHTHSSEEVATTQWFTEKYGMTPVEYAASIGVLDEKTILAHQVQTTENDFDLIQQSGAAVVHNPLANTILGSGMPDVLEMLERGIPLCISTDGSGSSDNQNILNAARVAGQFQKANSKDASVLPSIDLLEMVTKIPAQILGLQKGVLEQGYDADMIVVDLDSLNMTPTVLDTAVENVVWASAGNEIRYVVANGRVVVDDYEVNVEGVDVEGIKEGVVRLSELFFEYLGSNEFKGFRGTGSNV